MFALVSCEGEACLGSQHASVYRLELSNDNDKDVDAEDDEGVQNMM